MAFWWKYKKVNCFKVPFKDDFSLICACFVCSRSVLKPKYNFDKPDDTVKSVFNPSPDGWSLAQLALSPESKNKCYP